MFFVYILHSELLDKYYVGYTSDVSQRLIHHNSRQNKWTKRGVPWTLVHHIPVENRAEAMKLERKIKNIGAGRFLSSLEK